MKVSAPQWISSSTAMEADGPPIPVETTLYFFSVEIAGVGGVFPVLGDLYRIVEMLCNLFTASGIARQDHVASHIPGADADVIFFSFCIDKFTHKLPPRIRSL